MILFFYSVSYSHYRNVSIGAYFIFVANFHVPLLLCQTVFPPEGATPILHCSEVHVKLSHNSLTTVPMHNYNRLWNRQQLSKSRDTGVHYYPILYLPVHPFPYNRCHIYPHLPLRIYKFFISIRTNFISSYTVSIAEKFMHFSFVV